MKKFFTVLLTVILLVSQFSVMSVFAATVAGTQADPIKAGDTATLLAKDFGGTVKTFKTYENGKNSDQASPSGYGQFIYGGGTKFEFYCDTAQKVNLTVKIAPWAQTESKTILAFFNPVAMPESLGGLVEGEGYPARNEAFLDYKFTAWTDFAKIKDSGATYAYSIYSNPENWIEKSGIVDAVAGKNILWFPKDNVYSTGTNQNVSLYSLTIESLEEPDDDIVPEKTTVYVSDIEDKINYLYDSWNKTYTVASYLGETNTKGNTSIRSNSVGNYTSIPFSVVAKGDYIVNVYYGMWSSATGNQYRKAALYLDQKPTETPNQLKTAWTNTSDTTTENLAKYNEYRKTLGLETVAAYPDTTTAKWWEFKKASLSAIDTDTKITSADWYRTEPLGYYIDGTGIFKTDRASYFRVNSFVLNGLSKGDHTLTFLNELRDVNGNGSFKGDTETGYNFDIMINRIEIVPVTSDIKPAIATYVYNCGPVSTQTSRTNWTKYLTSIEDASILGTDITFGVEITNPSSSSSTVNYKVILAYYGEDDMLISVDNPEGNSFTVPVAQKTTVRKTFAKAINSIPQGTLKVKAFLWDVGNDLVVAAAKPTVLD